MENKLRYVKPELKKEGQHDSERVNLHEYPDWQVAELVEKGQRRYQEDASIVFPFGENGFVSVICDGHGLQDGNKVSEELIDLIKKFFSTTEPEEITANKIQELINQANEDLGKKYPEAGTTLLLTVAEKVKNGHVLHIGYVGDSEARILRPEGTLQSITPPHDSKNPEEKKRLEKDQNVWNEDLMSPSGLRMNVWRTVGDPDFPSASAQLSWVTCVLKTGEVVVLASDGLWKELDESTTARRDFCELLEKYPNPKDALNVFLKEKLSLSHFDNTSMQIIKGNNI